MSNGGTEKDRMSRVLVISVQAFKEEGQANPPFTTLRRDEEPQGEASDSMLPRKSSSQRKRDRTAIQLR
jgi:hypothetical protein